MYPTNLKAALYWSISNLSEPLLLLLSLLLLLLLLLWIMLTHSVTNPTAPTLLLVRSSNTYAYQNQINYHDTGPMVLDFSGSLIQIFSCYIIIIIMMAQLVYFISALNNFKLIYSKIRNRESSSKSSTFLDWPRRCNFKNW